MSGLKSAVVIPCFNEENLISRTLSSIPDFVDFIYVIDDASEDSTADVARDYGKKDSRVRVVRLEENMGVGGAVISGFQLCLAETDSDVIGIVAGDNQFDSSYLGAMLELLVRKKADYVKASRFFHREAFRTMPKYRQFGNILISLLTKFSTGYYSITDITNGCGFFTRQILEKVDFSIVRRRYDYETSMLTALAIADAKVLDYPVPAHYGDEKSTIKLIPTALRNLAAVWSGFWRRIFLKYVVFGFHPIALFLFAGIAFGLTGLVIGTWLVFERLVNGQQPSSGTMMLVALPLILGFQMVLSALSMDVANERQRD
jgi:glycosyltransferase involved in cell wall biosynthesis